MSQPEAIPGVVVTGIGVVSAIGQTVPEFWSAVRQGQSGISPLEDIMTDNINVGIAAQIRNFDCKVRLGHHQRDKTILLAERYSWLAAAAADEAIAQSGLETPFASPRRVACIIGTGAGGQHSAEKACSDRFLHNKRAAHPLLLVRIIGSSAAAHVGLEYGIKGPVFGATSACASGAHAIGIGRDLIRSGTVDVAVVGASESMITFGMLHAMQSMGVLSSDGCFPFDRRRTGTVLGEGAGILVLESQRHAEQRGATVLAELCGVGMTAGSADMVHSDTEGMATAMSIALADARLTPASIDYINAHGTATIMNDRNEADAIKMAFADRAAGVAVSSTKPMHGYAMGATGSIEAIACIKSISDNWVPPTLGLDEPDPGCDLDFVPDGGREQHVRYAMSNAFGFGGLNAVLIFGSIPR